jgi:hypothetical protein
MKKDNHIYKLGPDRFLKGELYFYQNIPSEIISYFPKLINYNKINDRIELELEYIKRSKIFLLTRDQIFFIIKRYLKYFLLSRI